MAETTYSTSIVRDSVVFALPLFAPYSTRLRFAQYAMDLGLERVRFIAPSAAMLIAWLMEHPDADEFVLALSEFATEGILASIDCGFVMVEEVSCLDFDQGGMCR